MSDVTQILRQIESGDPSSVAELLPLVYEELRKLAAWKMAQESSDHTLQPTALVHEAFLRLVNVDRSPQWHGRAHFFAAAAEAMRRILVEAARRKQRLKRGGQAQRQNLLTNEPSCESVLENVLAVDEAVSRLALEHPQAAELVKLRYFGGLSLTESASLLEVSTATAGRIWRYARAWLAHELRADDVYRGKVPGESVKAEKSLS